MMAPVAAKEAEEDAVATQQEEQEMIEQTQQQQNGREDYSDLEFGNPRSTDDTPFPSPAADEEDGRPGITNNNDNKKSDNDGTGDASPWVVPPGTEDGTDLDSYSVALFTDDDIVDNDDDGDETDVELATIAHDGEEEDGEGSDENEEEGEDEEEGDIDDSFFQIFSHADLDLAEVGMGTEEDEPITWKQRFLRALRCFTHVMLFPILVVSSVVLPVLIVVSCFILMVLAMFVLLCMYYCCHARNGDQAAVPFHVLVRQLLEAVEDDGGTMNGDGLGMVGPKCSRQEIQNCMLRRELIYVQHEGYPQITRESSEWEVEDALQLASLDEATREERMHQDMFPLEERSGNTGNGSNCDGEDKKDSEENEDDNLHMNWSQRSNTESGPDSNKSSSDSQHKKRKSWRKRRRDSNSINNIAPKDEAAEHLKLRCSNNPVTFMTDPPRNHCKLWMKTRTYVFAEPMPPEKEPESPPPHSAAEHTDMSRVFAAHDATTMPLAFPPHMAAHMHAAHNGAVPGPGTGFAFNQASSTSSFLSRIEDRPLYLFTSESSSDSGIASNGGGNDDGSSSSSASSDAASTSSRDQADGDSVYLEADHGTPDQSPEAVDNHGADDSNSPERSVVMIDQAQRATEESGFEQEDQKQTTANALEPVSGTTTRENDAKNDSPDQELRNESNDKRPNDAGTECDTVENSMNSSGDENGDLGKRVVVITPAIDAPATTGSSSESSIENGSAPSILQRIGLWSDDDEESAANDDGDNLDFGRLEAGLNHDVCENEDHDVGANGGGDDKINTHQTISKSDEAANTTLPVSNVENNATAIDVCATATEPGFHPDIRGTSTYCNICLLEYQKGDIICWSRRPNGCHHAFHEDCLLDWLKRKPTCPNCRQEYFSIDDKQTLPGGDGEDSNDEENQQDSSEPAAANGEGPATREESTRLHRRFRFRWRRG